MRIHRVISYWQFPRQLNSKPLRARACVEENFKRKANNGKWKKRERERRERTWVAKSSRMPSLLMPCSRQSCFQNSIPIWFPHCPTCRVIISLGIFFFSIYPEWKIKLGFLDGRKCETKESTLAVVLVLFEKVIREGNIRDEISESRELWWHLYTVKTEAWTLTESHSLTSVCLIKLELSG